MNSLSTWRRTSCTLHFMEYSWRFVAVNLTEKELCSFKQSTLSLGSQDKWVKKIMIFLWSTMWKGTWLSLWIAQGVAAFSLLKNCAKQGLYSCTIGLKETAQSLVKNKIRKTDPCYLAWRSSEAHAKSRVHLMICLSELYLLLQQSCLLLVWNSAVFNSSEICKAALYQSVMNDIQPKAWNFITTKVMEWANTKILTNNFFIFSCLTMPRFQLFYFRHF